MFFIIGIETLQKKLNFVQTMICSLCGKYGRYEVTMTYTCLTLFFIPTFRWNRHYYVTSSCCNATYQISDELGEAIRKGESITLSEQDLVPLYHEASHGSIKKCSHCGYEASADFSYCPKCGTLL